MKDPLYPKPTSLSTWSDEYRRLELPCIESMHERLILATGTDYEQWARDAFLIRAVLEQAIALANIAEYIYEDAFDASEIACDSRSKVHYSLRPLQREVMFRALDVFNQEAKSASRAEARKRRAEKTAAAPPPPKKQKASSANCQPLPEIHTAPTV